MQIRIQTLILRMMTAKEWAKAKETEVWVFYLYLPALQAWKDGIDLGVSSAVLPFYAACAVYYYMHHM